MCLKSLLNVHYIFLDSISSHPFAVNQLVFVFSLSPGSDQCVPFQPVKPQYYYGDNFGYIIAFKPRNGTEWRKVTVSDPLERRYTHKDATIPPYTEFDVKVKAYNHHGEGPYSRLASVFSAPEGKRRSPPRGL